MLGKLTQIIGNFLPKLNKTRTYQFINTGCPTFKVASAGQISKMLPHSKPDILSSNVHNFKLASTALFYRNVFSSLTFIAAEYVNGNPHMVLEDRLVW